MRLLIGLLALSTLLLGMSGCGEATAKAETRLNKNGQVSKVVQLESTDGVNARQMDQAQHEDQGKDQVGADNKEKEPKSRIVKAMLQALDEIEQEEVAGFEGSKEDLQKSLRHADEILYQHSGPRLKEMIVKANQRRPAPMVRPRRLIGVFKDSAPSPEEILKSEPMPASTESLPNPAVVNQEDKNEAEEQIKAETTPMSQRSEETKDPATLNELEADTPGLEAEKLETVE